MTSDAQISLSGSMRRVSRALVLLLALAGCRSAASELVEAELRDREKQLDELKQELDHKDVEIQALEADIARLQRKAARTAGEPMGPVLLCQSITLGGRSGGADTHPKTPAP